MSAGAAPPGLHGHLDLHCALDARGLSSLQRQSFRAPFHISKPHLDAGTLIVNLANPTAGILAGDRATVHVSVAADAALLLTTPAANRAFRMRDGSAALEQRFEVAAGGRLDVWPEIFIPQAGTRFQQHTEIRADPGAEVLFFEALAPGRVASRETFAYARLRWETDLWIGDRLAARERYTLEPGGPAVQALRAQFPAAYYASCLVVTERLTAGHPCWAALRALHGDDLWIGSSALRHGGWVVKLLAAGSIGLRRGLAVVRRELYAALARPEPALRRVAPLG